MRQATNRENIEGRVYQHDLKLNTVQNTDSKMYGVEYIAGTIEVAVDEDMLNIVPVHYTFVTATTSKGAANPTYSNLMKIMNGATVVKEGKDEAIKVKLSPSIALNDFYNQNGDLVSTKTNEGGFVTIVTTLGDESDRNRFTADMVITEVTHVDANEERHIDEHTSVKGAIFNFRNGLLPVEFTVENKQGMEYFEGLDVSNANPIYTKVWGKVNCETKTEVRSEESAFGEAAVRTYERKVKSYVITGTSTSSYEFGEEGILTAEELTKASQDRQVYLADVKKRSEEYRASKAATPVTTTSATTATTTSGFNF